VAPLFANLAIMNRRVLALIVIPFFLFAFGTIGYMLIEGWNVFDAFYMTAITLTTVGFGEVRALTTGGRMFTVALLVAGVAFIAYGLEYLLTANLGETWRERRMRRTIENMENHVIVCGYGRVGQSAIASLLNSKRQVVVVEKSAEKTAVFDELDLVYLIGDATKDEVLHQAGIDRAWGMLICTGDDSRNLFIVLSARALNNDLYIVTRSVDAENDRKMRRAGANRVVSPYQIGGQHMANIIIRPHVTDFFDVVTLDGGIELWVEELVIGKTSPLIGKAVGEANIRQDTGVSIIAMWREGRSTIPDARTMLQAGDELIVIGTREQLSELEKLTGVDIGHL
jgi:voltage-gated potassium channel